MKKDNNFIKLFIRFLKNENAYNSFITYSNHNYVTELETHKPQAFMVSGYKGWTWNETKEGRSFWRLLNTKWLYLLLIVDDDISDTDYEDILTEYEYFKGTL